MLKELTGKQEAFAQYVADGLLLTEAYLRAYDWKGKRTGSHVKACELAGSPRVNARIFELKAEAAKLKGASREVKRMVLETLIVDRDLTAAERVQAIREDNAMTGDNAPIKVSHTGLAEVMERVRASSKGGKR